jgi:hypothetical protein
LKELQGVLGLVEDEDGMVAVVDEADGPVRVVCPKAELDIKQTATRMVRMLI